MIKRLLFEKMRDQGLSLRDAATEMGISHTTVSRLLAGKSPDLDTLAIVAHWLRVPLTALIDFEDDAENEIDLIRLAFSLSPGLVRILSDITHAVLRTGISPQIIEGVAAYAEYRINESKQKSKKEKTDRSL